MSEELTKDQTYCDVGAHIHCGGVTTDEADPEPCMCWCHDSDEMRYP